MKGVLVHGALALLGLAAAYSAWTKEDAASIEPGEVTLASCEERSFESAQLMDEVRQIRVEARKHAGEPIYWVTSTRRLGDTTLFKDKAHKPAKPDKAVATGGKAGAEGGNAGADTQEAGDSKSAKAKEPKTRVQSFLGNDRLEKFISRHTPLRALRSLGSASEERLKDFGLDKPKKRIELRCGGATHKFELGSTTYGAGNYYARRAGQEAVVLLASAVVRELEGAEWRFLQKELHAFDHKDVDEARITVQGSTRRLLQRNRSEPRQSLWVDAAAPDRRNELFGNWLSQVGRMSAISYVGLDEQPGADLAAEQAADQQETAEIAVVEYFLEGKAKGKLELVRIRLSRDVHYYARTETTRTWVKVPKSVGSVVDRDAALVVGLEQPEDKPAPAATSSAAGPSALPAGHPPLPGHPPVKAPTTAAKHSPKHASGRKH